MGIKHLTRQGSALSAAHHTSASSRGINAFLDRCSGRPLPKPQTCVIRYLFAFAEEHEVLLVKGPAQRGTVFIPPIPLSGDEEHDALLVVVPGMLFLQSRANRKTQRDALAMMRGHFEMQREPIGVSA